MDDGWIKRKFLKAILPYDRQLATTILLRPDFASLSSNEVLSEVVSIGILNKTADNAVARSRGTRRSPNLALKSKAVECEECYEEEEEEGCGQEDTKYAFSEHMALASRACWNNKNNFKKPFNARDQSNSKTRIVRSRT